MVNRNILQTNVFVLQDVRRKVARVVAAKCTLAARVDSFHENPEGDVGQGTLKALKCKPLAKSACTLVLLQTLCNACTSTIVCAPEPLKCLHKK